MSVVEVRTVPSPTCDGVQATGTWPFSAPALRFLLRSVAPVDAGRDSLATELPPMPRDLEPVTVGVVRAIESVEADPMVHTVGAHSYPNAAGALQLDAGLIELRFVAGASDRRATLPSARFGAVAALEGYAGAIRAASFVLSASPHTLLVGDGAAKFCRVNGLPSSLTPVPTFSGPSACTAAIGSGDPVHQQVELKGRHDTVGIVALDRAACDGRGAMAIGCSSSGMRGKQPGRVGDSPLCCHGLYGEAGIGGAVATGDGDAIATFPLCYLVVAELAGGCDPCLACRKAIEKFAALPHVPSNVEVAVCALTWDGRAGAWCTPNWSSEFRWTTLTA